MYNVEDYIGESIDSVINQTFDFNKVQVILVDDGSTDSTKDIALEYQSKYPDNILVLSKDNGGVASARNLGLEHAKGKYINFLDSDDKLSSNTLEEIDNFFNKNKEIDIISIPMIFFERREGFHPLSSKFKNQTTIVDLEDNFFDIQLHISSSFIRKESIEGHTFNTNVINGSDALFLNEILIIKKKYALMGLNKNVCYFYRKRFALNSIIDSSAVKEEFFTEKLKYFSKYLLNYSIEKEGYVLKFIQSVVIYDLQSLIRKPELPDSFSDYDINEFWTYFEDILTYIDEDIIFNSKFLDNNVKNFFIYFKRNDFHTVIKNNKVFLKSGDHVINKLHRHNFYFDFVELKNNFLNFSGSFVSNCNSEFLKVIAELKYTDGRYEIFDASHVEYFDKTRISKKSFLSNDWKFVYNFDLKVPLTTNELFSIKFKLVYSENDNEVVMKPSIRFREYCNINNSINYFVKDSRIIISENNMFYSLPYSYLKLAKLSFKSIVNIIKERTYSHMVFYILIYLFSYPFIKNKEIWLFEDKPSVADDNAKYLFSYAIKQEDNIKKYFVIDKKSSDYSKLLKIDKNIIAFKSFKHKFLYLFASKFISSHTDKVFLNPFYDENGYLEGIATSDKYFLQHGVIKDDLSTLLRKYYYNLSLFVTSSDIEKNSIVNGKYNYDDETVQTLGLPRYDYLKNNNTSKEILFIPTWRNYLTNETLFINSEYYERLNSFFNNEKLINILKEKGYTLVFKPHYNLLPFIDLFDINNDNIRIATDESYQELFDKSCLMITDYSSVFFDFGYLKKPIIYYQSDDYHYLKDYFDYETMGFGEIVKEESELIDEIVRYIDNGPNMDDKYKDRVDEFFKYNDQNNCKRCYEWICNH